MEDKKGQVLLELFTFITVGFAFILIVGIFLYFFGIVNTSLSEDINAGAVNLSNATANTFGQINTAFLTNADLIGIFFLLGTVMAIFLLSYFQRNSTIKVMIIFDIILMLFAYIIAIYISNSYEQILLVLPFADIFIENLNTSSRFMLLLPQITIVVAVIAMILAYSGIPRTSEEEVGGF